MMNTQQDEFLQTLNGETPTPAQAAQLLELGLQGETGALNPDEGGEPNAAPAAGTEPANSDASKNVVNAGANAVAAGAEPDPANTVIMAKDGKHTIGYEKLAEAREGERHWKAQYAAANAELESLRSQAQARAAAGQEPTQADTQVAAAQAAIDAGIDPDIFGDFSEEALAKGIQKLVSAKVAEQVDAIVEKKLAPIQQKHTNDATEQHYNAIYTKHPDADSIAESKELADWIGAQPSFAQAGYLSVLDKGTTDQIIELFDTFKQATGKTQAAVDAQPNTEEMKAKAKAAVAANANGTVPASLTDFPGGRAAGVTREEAMDDMTGPDMLASMASWTPEQIDAYLNRRL